MSLFASLRPQEIAEIITGLATVATVLVAVVSIRHNYRINKVNMMMQVTLHCALRYDELKLMLAENLGSCDARLGEIYYARFWGLKSDQFDYWVDGYLDHDTFCDWAYSTIKAFAREQGAFGVSMLDSWMHHKDREERASPEFTNFIDALVRVSREDRNRYDQMLGYICRLEGTWYRPGFARKVRRSYSHEISWSQHLRIIGKRRRDLVKVPQGITR